MVAMIGVIAAIGSYATTGQIIPGMVNDMLLIAASMVGGFIFAALLTDGNIDDDDGPDGGIMQPLTTPT